MTTIHIWMHWFWITWLSYRGVFVLVSLAATSTSAHSSLSSIVEAGLDNTDGPGNSDIFDDSEKTFNLFSDETSQTSKGVFMVDRRRRHVEDEGDISVEAVPLPTSSTSSPVHSSNLKNEATWDGKGPKDGGDSLDIFNGGNLDLPFPATRKHSTSKSKYMKKTIPKTSNGAVLSEKTVETVKIVAEEIQLQENRVSAENETRDATYGTDASESDENSTQGHGLETTEAEAVENATAVAIVVANEMKLRNETNLKEEIDEPILSDEPVNNGPMTEIVVASGEGNKNVIHSNISIATEVQKTTRVVQHLTDVTVDESMVHTTVQPFLFNNRVAAATSSENKERLNHTGLDAGSITGITLGIVVVSGLFGAISFVLYRRRYLNKPQALNDKSSNLDSSGYIDDTSLRENSEEMYSLDNDSFLNSLEAMTIQNYWTENVKHTKL